MPARLRGDARALELAQAKWRSSGISDKAAQRLKLSALSEGEAEALGSNFYPVRSLLFPYFDLNGKRTKFYRVRYLETLPGFQGQVKKPQRYAQPTGTLNEVYLPPLLDWSRTAPNTDRMVLITEGELKAAAGCAAGYATVGLGGVDVWRATKIGRAHV